MSGRAYWLVKITDTESGLDGHYFAGYGTGGDMEWVGDKADAVHFQSRASAEIQRWKSKAETFHDSLSVVFVNPERAETRKAMAAHAQAHHALMCERGETAKLRERVAALEQQESARAAEAQAAAQH